MDLHPYNTIRHDTTRHNKSLVGKCAKTNFNNVGFAIVVREVGSKFHRNFVVGFKAHP
jgi:hypothetical protein